MKDAKSIEPEADVDHADLPGFVRVDTQEGSGRGSGRASNRSANEETAVRTSAAVAHAPAQADSDEAFSAEERLALVGLSCLLICQHLFIFS